MSVSVRGGCPPDIFVFVRACPGRLPSNLKDTGNVTDIIGFWLSGLIALGIIVIGARIGSL